MSNPREMSCLKMVHSWNRLSLKWHLSRLFKWCVGKAGLSKVDLNGKHFPDEHMFIRWSVCNGEHIKLKPGGKLYISLRRTAGNIPKVQVLVRMSKVFLLTRCSIWTPNLSAITQELYCKHSHGKYKSDPRNQMQFVGKMQYAAPYVQWCVVFWGFLTRTMPVS